MWKGKLPCADLSIAWSSSSRWNGSTVSLKATSLDDPQKRLPTFRCNSPDGLVLLERHVSEWSVSHRVQRSCRIWLDIDLASDLVLRWTE